jgi:hypothetical protein
MAVLSLPRIPTLEPVQNAVSTAMDAYLMQALADVAALFPAAPLPTRPPKDSILATIQDFTLVRKWPTLSIEASNLRMTRPAEQLGAGLWSGDLEVLYFERNGDPSTLAALLHRYAAAIWAVLVYADSRNELDGARLDLGSLSIEASEPGGSSATDRAVSVRCGVIFQT